MVRCDYDGARGKCDDVSGTAKGDDGDEWDGAVVWCELYSGFADDRLVFDADDG